MQPLPLPKILTPRPKLPEPMTALKPEVVVQQSQITSLKDLYTGKEICFGQ